MVAAQKFHTKQKNNSSNNYPHFVGQSYGTTECKNNANALSSFDDLVKITIRKFLFCKFNVKIQLSNLKEQKDLRTQPKTTRYTTALN